jgi:hypothetical protein
MALVFGWSYNVTIRLSGEESTDDYNEVTDETPSINYVYENLNTWWQ